MYLLTPVIESEGRMGSGEDVPATRRSLRIGVDVGGTNTDGVILDLAQSGNADKGVVAWHKTVTTSHNPGVGIINVIAEMLAAGDISPRDIASVTIGTTAFVNAVIERDASRLMPVAVVRLSGPFSKHVPPCVDWPEDLRDLVLGYYALVKGGLEVDGNLISDIDEAELRAEAAKIHSSGIHTVVVNGVFSPIDTVHRQEERAAAIIKAEIPGCDVVCAKDVASLGFLERENAAILNASILQFAREKICSFDAPLRRLGLTCPVFFTQNDGTILSGDMALRLPIRTFLSGPTNSMRGAAYLVKGGENGSEEEAMMVVDIGGTTTDVGLLQANGFPRQSAAYSELAGVRMNFSCPDVKSIGVGGGSIVRLSNPGKELTVGPDSEGDRLLQAGQIFGGLSLTATDCAVFANPSLQLDGVDTVDTVLVAKGREALGDYAQKCMSIIKEALERSIDNMKDAQGDLPVILVGGGAIIAPDQLIGASKVIKPRFSNVANAIGAAIARVSAVIDTVKSTERKTVKQLTEEISKEAIEKTIAAGAAPASVKVVDIESLPLAYIANKTRFIIRAAGDFDFSRADLNELTAVPLGASSSSTEVVEDYSSVTFPVREKRTKSHTPAAAQHPSVEPDKIPLYKPDVRNRVWYVSETDLSWISTGCYILGTGGGGSPYASMILLRQLLRRGAVVRVVNPHDVDDDAAVGCGCGAGSPTVSIEKLQGDEMMEAQTELYKMCDKPASHMIALEIGGGNGLQGMTLGASTNMDIPCVDGDWMGRAYPTKWQTTPVVFNERSPIWSPIAIADGNGNVVAMPKATSDTQVERIMRVALSEMGSQVGCADPPVTGVEMKRWVVEHTLSQAWRIGRAVALATAQSNRVSLSQAIIDACGGSGAAKVLWAGKVVGVERTLRRGYVYGECIIEGGDTGLDDNGPSSNTAGVFRGRVKIPFKNENIAAIRIPDDASSAAAAAAREEPEKQEDVLAIVPDLISVIDAFSGEAVGTPEYRYGLWVVVIGIAASDKWTGTARGIELGGPKAFGFEHLEYKPLGQFVKPVSVIDEFDVPSK
ncbi:hypothetical protein B0H63DRAFT_425219 [Podospora didyma]|uniref:Hydantoinase n=1 Tax=Podospora didyma TaxID=330526 RepID=A0AAE0P4W2_9PEZI|nr:hypothetical protein B0H63DRAFT_425219 [Podospora didyma]